MSAHDYSEADRLYLLQAYSRLRDYAKSLESDSTVKTDLLAALEELVAEHGEPFNFHHETEGFNMARAAIAKTKGEA